jgi:hypothetical protein
LIEAKETTAGPRHGVATPDPDVQFVDLRRRQGDALPSRTQPLGNRPTLKTDGRRDRLEIIRLARQMLQAGTPAEIVRRMLPISDAELAFLQSATAQ